VLRLDDYRRFLRRRRPQQTHLLTQPPTSPPSSPCARPCLRKRRCCCCPTSHLLPPFFLLLFFLFKFFFWSIRNSYTFLIFLLLHLRTVTYDGTGAFVDFNLPGKRTIKLLLVFFLSSSTNTPHCIAHCQFRNKRRVDATSAPFIYNFPICYISHIDARKQNGSALLLSSPLPLLFLYFLSFLATDLQCVYIRVLTHDVKCRRRCRQRQY